MRDILLGAVRLSLVALVLCGLAYPLSVATLGQWLLPWQANGSLKTDARGEIIGSHLIGQRWEGPEWFHGRPSATTAADPQNPDQIVASPYNAAGSGGSNLGPASKLLFARLQTDREVLEQVQPELRGRALPADVLTTSGSGLDPDISPANAALQAPRIAQSRNVPVADIHALIAAHTVGRTWRIFGEPRVNVLELNLALAHVSAKP
jgi:potassium-transporting ATPase KdpC subunit